MRDITDAHQRETCNFIRSKQKVNPMFGGEIHHRDLDDISEQSSHQSAITSWKRPAVVRDVIFLKNSDSP
jgi:hypothetical protein